MAPGSESAYLAKARQAGRPIVRDLPKFDLDQYIANYRGTTFASPQSLSTFTNSRQNAGRQTSTHRHHGTVAGPRSFEGCCDRS